VVEVGDCWLDAGIVPFTTLGYFDRRDEWEDAFPAEWICEMREQVRLWFYSMLFMSATLTGRAPYQEVLAYERVISEEGTRFSKTGFMIRFDEAVERMGADPMRYLYCAQPVATELRFGYGAGEAAARKLIEIWNVYGFFVTYALIDRPFCAVPQDPQSLGIADRWLLARTAAMVGVVTEAYEAYNTPAALREIERYADDLSNWYVRLNRRRFWRDAAEAGDKEACYGVLFASLRSVALVLAPIVPFMSEELWQNAVRTLEPGAAESVHHASWPELPTEWRDDALLASTSVVREVVSLAQNLRTQAKTRVRQPLPAVYVLLNGEARVDNQAFSPEQIRAAVEEQEALIKSELNVKDVRVVSDPSLLRQGRLKVDFRKAGPVLKGEVNKVKTLLEQMDATTMAGLVDRFDRGESVSVDSFADLPPAIFERVEDVRPGILELAAGNLVVAIDTNLSPGLVQEGMVRDLVRHLQVLRKNAGLEVSDRVDVGLVIDGHELTSAVAEHRGYVMDEVLAVELTEGALGDAAGESEFKIMGHEVRATVRRRQPEATH
jgi:isoleucyl-tRNA synthetase